MQARGPLMVEHRLILRMIGLVQAALSRIQATGKADPLFVDTAVDFMRMYADRTHHGKEEDILFRDLAKRPLTAEDRRMMEDLVQDHILGRLTTQALVDANTRYRNGDSTAIAAMTKQLQTLVDFYPKHIEKEDKLFFPAVRKYFTDADEQVLLVEFGMFDQKLIHEKYKSVVDALNQESGRTSRGGKADTATLG